MIIIIIIRKIIINNNYNNNNNQIKSNQNLFCIMQGQNQAYRYIHACPLRNFTSCAHFSLVIKLLIILHPTMPSGNVFHKFTVRTAKKYFLMSKLAKNLCNFNLFPLVEYSPDDKHMQLSRFIHICPFKILYNIMISACMRRNSNNSRLHNLSLSA